MKFNEKFTVMDAVLLFELGELDEDEILELFQELVNTGMAWQLQGSYGRTAQQLINEGLIDAPSNTK